MANDIDMEQLASAIEEVTTSSIANHEAVNHPAHYAEGRKYEPIAVIEDWNLGFSLGNTVKYISRAGRKSSMGLEDTQKEIQDLEKAAWYLDRRIKELKEGLCD